MKISYFKGITISSMKLNFMRYNLKKITVVS